MSIDEFRDAQAAMLARHGIVAEERWVDVPSMAGRAHVLVAGDGPPIALLNGIGVPAAMMAPMMAQLDGFTLYAVDLPAFGLTDTTTEFTDDLRGNAVRFLQEVFDGLGLARPAIVANSLGSLWATWLATDHPSRVAALAHVGCPAIVLDTSAPLPMRLLSVRPLGWLMTQLQPPSARQVEQLSRMVHEHPLPPELGRLILATERLDHFDPTFRRMLNRLLRLRGSRPTLAIDAGQLAAIDTPTLLVFARNDPMGGPDTGAAVAAAMPDVELHVVDGGHAPWVHHADQVAPILTAFLHRVGAARALGGGDSAP